MNRSRPSPTRALARQALVCLSCALLTAAAATGQESILALELSFSNPGARSMGFGGAFVALADDATAAFANPAGLVQLTRPEISAEGRAWSYSTPYTLGGRVEGQPSGFGIDDTAGLRIAESEDTVSDLSFLSVVYPQGRWAIAAYRHQLASFEFSGATQGLFGSEGARILRFEDQRDVFDIDVASHAVSGAYRLSDWFSLGLTIVFFDARMSSVAENFHIDEPTLEAFFGEISYLPERMSISERFTIDDGNFGGSVGFLWSLSERWKLGGFHRLGAEIDMNVEIVSGPALEPRFPAGTILADQPVAPMTLPDVSGLGLAYRSGGGRLTLAAEWDRVEYSDLFAAFDQQDLQRVIADGDEIHLGAEFVARRARPVLAVRLGGWLDPDHEIRYLGENPVIRALRLPGDDELHLAAGLGLVFAKAQIDLGVDLSDRVDSVSISTVYAF